MTHDPPHVLLLAGTHEARILAGEIPRQFPNLRLTASFAGAVKDLPNLGVATRVGGFGGVEGLADYIADNRIALVVDATHPFAAQMSWNAYSAAELTGVPLIRLERPAWRQEPEDVWHPATSMKDAAVALPDGARAFLAVGRKEIDVFRGCPGIVGVARMIEPPSAPLPGTWCLILGRPPQDVDDEVALFQNHGITHLVTKNSGGLRAYSKLLAARRLRLPVLMVARPELPPCKTAGTVSELLPLIKASAGPERVCDGAATS